MEITSKSSVINRLELRRCIQLLDSEYYDLPYQIYIYKDRDEIEIESRENPDMSAQDYNYILNNVEYTPIGICVHEKKLIKLFPFNLDGDPLHKYLMVYFAFHEIRHAWQNHHGKFLDESETKLEREHMGNYLKSPAEKDAHKFGVERVNENKNKIIEILGLVVPYGKGITDIDPHAVLPFWN